MGVDAGMARWSRICASLDELVTRSDPVPGHCRDSPVYLDATWPGVTNDRPGG